jgi:hypothetical protein
MQELLNNKLILNKLYKFGNSIVKLKKIQKLKNTAIAVDVNSGEEIEFPIQGSDLILHRLYTIGEISKIVERRPDTIRKYEKKGLIPKPDVLNDLGPYKNWRLYGASHVYEMIEFFGGRSSGRPKAKQEQVKNKIQTLNQKVKLVNRSL